MTKPQVLIVEDEGIIARDIEDRMAKLNYAVSGIASTGEQAVEKAIESRPDIVLMDIKLKGQMDGIEAARQIRTSLDVPVVYLTAYADDELLQRAKETQPAGYILKPFQDRELHAVIQTALYKHEKEKKLKEGKRVQLQESEERYRTLYSAMKEGVCLHEVIYDESGEAIDYKILDINPAYERITGLKREEAMGSIASQLYGNAEPPYLELYAKVAKSGESTSFETYFPPMDKHFHISVFSPRRGQFATVFSDITEGKQAELHIKKLYSLQTAIRDINQELLCFKDEAALFHQVCAILAKVEFVNSVWIGMTGEGSFDIKPVAQIGFEEEFLATVKVAWNGSEYGSGPSGTAIKTKQPVVINDIASDPNFAPWRAEAMQRGTAASISLPLIFEGKAIVIINIGSAQKDVFGDEEVSFLTEVAGDIAVGIRASRLQKEINRSVEKLRLALNNTVAAIGLLCEQKDPYTAGHQRRTTQLAVAIARGMNLPQDTVDGIEIASLIHDIGKFTVPSEILSKPGKLSEFEFGIIKAHSDTAYQILKGLDFPWPVAKIILQHHERMNGSGYPQGLSADNICIEARILAVADVVEAMSSHRPYRPALGVGMALEEILQKKGILYDAEVADACIRLFYEKEFHFE